MTAGISANAAIPLVPSSTPVPVEGDVMTTDIGYEGRLHLADGCIRLISHFGGDDGPLLIFPPGHAA